METVHHLEEGSSDLVKEPLNYDALDDNGLRAVLAIQFVTLGGELPDPDVLLRLSRPHLLSALRVGNLVLSARRPAPYSS